MLEEHGKGGRGLGKEDNTRTFHPHLPCPAQARTLPVRKHPRDHHLHARMALLPVSLQSLWKNVTGQGFSWARLQRRKHPNVC